MNITWTTEQTELLRKAYGHSTQAELLQLLPEKNIAAIRSKAKALNLRKNIQRFCFTNQQIEYLKSNYSKTLNIDLANQLGCSIHTVENKGFQLGLKKDKEFLKGIFRRHMERPDHPGKKHWIKKGNTPANKGKKQAEYMTPEAIERTKATQFKKGQSVWNHRPVGYERITRDGYTEVKTAEPNVFKLKHRVIWEKKYGEIPSGHNIQFKDGNRSNLDIDNLYMISQRDQMKNENSIHAIYPEEIRNAIHTMAALSRQINKRLNQ